MAVNTSGDDFEKARRFRDAALPYLDDAYTLARYSTLIAPVMCGCSEQKYL